MTPLAPIHLIDDILTRYKLVLGNAFAGYRNHAQRVALSCESLAALDRTQREQVHVAAAFHDLGIWSAGTFDYLAPSMTLAHEYLETTGQLAWEAQVASMIEDHHRVRAPVHPLAPLSDVFRTADWIDVTMTHRVTLRERPLPGLFGAFPSAGFHALIARMTARQFVKTPTRPIPALRF